MSPCTDLPISCDVKRNRSRQGHLGIVNIVLCFIYWYIFQAVFSRLSIFAMQFVALSYIVKR